MLSVCVSAVPKLPPGLISARSPCVICLFLGSDLSETAYENIGDMSRGNISWKFVKIAEIYYLPQLP